jgi:asparagine synthase (glutamine-hydrolysing)
LWRSPAHGYAELFTGSYFGRDDLPKMLHADFKQATEDADAGAYIVSQYQNKLGAAGALQFDLMSYLPDDLNVKMDRATMRFGLEARAPFLDQELVAFALSLPLSEKVNHGKTKIALKRALRGVVPNEVLNRRKRGFQVPLAKWFRGPLKNMVEERLTQGPITTIIRSEHVRRLIHENARGADHGNRLWMLLSLSSWLSRYGN